MLSQLKSPREYDVKRPDLPQMPLGGGARLRGPARHVCDRASRRSSVAPCDIDPGSEAMRSILLHWKFWAVVVGAFVLAELGLGLSLTHAASTSGERLNTATVLDDQPGLSIGRNPTCHEELTLRATGSNSATYLYVEHGTYSKTCPTSPQYAPGQVLTLYQTGGADGPMSMTSVHSTSRIANRWIGSTVYAGLIAGIAALMYGIWALIRLATAQARTPTDDRSAGHLSGS